MNKYLEQLIEISKIDKEIDSFEPRIANAKSEITKVISQKDKLLNEVALLKDEAKELSLKIYKNEAHLAEINKKIEDVGRKWKSVKTEKENKALSLEDEILKEQLTFANEEIERINKNKEQKALEIQEKQDEITELDEKEKALEEDVQEELKEIQDQREKVFAKKGQLTQDMDQKIIIFYEKIRKWAKNTSVVAIYKQACGGCFIRLNDKMFMDILRSEDIITCPHCGRILYIKPEDESAELDRRR